MRLSERKTHELLWDVLKAAQEENTPCPFCWGRMTTAERDAAGHSDTCPYLGIVERQKQREQWTADAAKIFEGTS